MTPWSEATQAAVKEALEWINMSFSPDQLSAEAVQYLWKALDLIQKEEEHE